MSCNKIQKERNNLQKKVSGYEAYLKSLKNKQGIISKFFKKTKYNYNPSSPSLPSSSIETTNKKNINQDSYIIEYNEIYQNNGSYNSYRYPVHIMDFFTDSNFIIFLDSIKNYIIQLNQKIIANTINLTRIHNITTEDLKKKQNLFKEKYLLIYIIENFITEDLYNILVIDILYTLYNDIHSISTLGQIKKNVDRQISKVTQSISNRIKSAYSTFISKSEENKTEIIYNETIIDMSKIKDNIIKLNFQGITNLIIKLKMYQKFNNKFSNNKKIEEYKKSFLINILILFFNYLYDNRNTYTRISKKLFDNISQWIVFLYKILPGCVHFDKLKETVIQIINSPEYDGILYFTNKKVIIELIYGILAVNSVASFAFRQKCSPTK